MMPDLTAYDRLEKDGAYSKEAVRRRIALIAAERMLDPRQTRRLMKGRWLTVRDLGLFMEKHHLSADWLLAGDLKGRLRMARKEVGVQTVPRSPRPMPEAVQRVLQTLDDRELKAVKRVMAALDSTRPG